MKRSSWINKAVSIIMLAAFLTCAGCFREHGNDASETAAPSASPAPTAEPMQGGTLRLPMPVNAPFIDPLQVDTEEMLNLFSLMYDKLISVTPSGELEPCLCESWTNEGDGVWLLRLREGVKWHDGTAFTADDVLYTYNALVNMQKSYYKPCLERLTGIEIVDDLTVRASFNVKGLVGLYSLCFPIKRPAPLVGTGAYKLVMHDDERITLRVNSEWWDKAPYIEHIVFSERDSNATALASFEAGQLNMVPTDILTAGKYAELGVTNVYDIMTQYMEAMLFNHESSVFSDKTLRLAVAHAVNRSRIITNIYMNRARVADAPIPPDSWLNSTISGTMSYDTVISLELIEQAGFTVISGAEDGLRYTKAGESLDVKLLTSATTDNTVRSDAAQLIANGLDELGFHVEVVTKKHTLGDANSEFLKALREGDWDMALVGFNLGLGCDLSSYVDYEGANNFGHIYDPQLEAYSNRILAAQTEEELREAVQTFQDYFLENIPFITLYFRLNSIICSADILGMDGLRKPFIFRNEKNWYFHKKES